MKKTILFLASFLWLVTANSQTNVYEISFENAVHHEAAVKASFSNIISDTLIVRMARSSPGRYALHEFSKNVYGLKAFNSKGNTLQITRPNPYEWYISGHDGSVNINYILFANRGDGTYSQIDETHAHLNIPSTFMYAPELKERKISVNFKVREDLNWKVATQLPLISGTTYSAPNLQYFMDSPTEISNFTLKEFQIDGKNIQLALHNNGTETEADIYFEKVKKVVIAEKEVFGELPNFDYDTYTFLACYVPNASGDGMEHRNSTILTSTRTLANGGIDRNIGTVSHEFFHAWNVERIRPKTLEPFNFSKANMTGALWFAEGFTSYYTNLILCRAGLITPDKYIQGLHGNFNYVWNSPARQFFNPIEMSYQAPFVDAATTLDPTNRENMFISYYSYGSVLGLALDLSLRQNNLNLDDFMKLVWESYGKNEIPYTVHDLHSTLNKYAGKAFGDNFFNRHIYKSEMPDYKSLLSSFGVSIKQASETPYIGVSISINKNNQGVIQNNPKIGSPAYLAGLDKGDILTSINGHPFPTEKKFEAFIKEFKVGTSLEVAYKRYGVEKIATIVLKSDPKYIISLLEKEGKKPTKLMLDKRKEWLKIE